MKGGGVGLYVKVSLPSRDRSNLATLAECIVSETQIDRIKYFLAVIYRSPSQEQSEFDYVLINFELLLANIHAENPFCVVITGDFYCFSTQWWGNDIEDNEGKLFEQLSSELDLHRLIAEPTHLLRDSKPCIYLILTNQPNSWMGKLWSAVCMWPTKCIFAA